MPNNLRSLYGTLCFDDGYYSIAFSPYVSQGGGGLLGGYGTMSQPIFPDVYEDEYNLSKDLQKRLKEHRAKAPKAAQPSGEWMEAMKVLDDELKASAPKGNIFALQSKGFRRRGWGTNAMPQAGRGMIFEIDWCGTGNNLLTRESVLLADFIGYEQAGGTQDLHLCFHKWKPAVRQHQKSRRDGPKVGCGSWLIARNFGTQHRVKSRFSLLQSLAIAATVAGL